MSETVGGRVLVAVEPHDRGTAEQAFGRRAVVELDDGRIVGVRAFADGFGEALYRPQDLHAHIVLAERVLSGSPAALTHPNTTIALACALIATIAAIGEGMASEPEKLEGGA